jgi:PAS domain S-box-containing protein
LALLHLSHPMTWGMPAPALWYSPLGVGIALAGWLGPVAALLVVIDGFLVAIQTRVLGTFLVPGQGVDPSLAVVGEAIWTALEVWAAWWVYFRAAKNPLALNDPHSATLFLLIIPGGVVGLWTLVRVGLAWALGPVVGGVTQPLVSHPWSGATVVWVTRSLSILALAPLLWVLATPPLLRWGWVSFRRPFHALGAESVERMSWGDRTELVGLTLATGLLGLVLGSALGRGEGNAWFLWGVPLLLIIWATLRQGVRGGVVVAGSAAVFCLVAEPLVGGAGLHVTPLQGNLLAQAITGLLAGASVSWMRLNEARYRQVVGHIPVVLYSARLWPGLEDRDQVEITFVSPASRVLFGRKPEQLQGDFGRWLKLVHPQDRELLVAALGQLRLSLQQVTCEYRVTVAPKDSPSQGSADSTRGLPRPRRPVPTTGEVWVRDTRTPLLDDGGRLAGWEGVVEDITEQRALAVDLRHTSGMLHTLVAHLPTGVFFIQGPTGQPILVNARARQLLGQREDSAVGVAQLPALYRLHRPDGTPFPADDLPVARALRYGEAGMSDDVIIHRADGRRIPLVSWAAPVDLGGQGKHDAAVWVFEDRTALHQAEAARLESEARLRAVIDTMAEGLIVQEPSGRIIECNPAACEILGLSAVELRTRSSLGPPQGCSREDGSPIPPEEHPAMVSQGTGRPVRGVVMGVPLGAGRVRWILVNAMPAFGRGSKGRVVTTFADITAYREALDVVRASEEKYRGLLESLPLMLVQCESDLRLTYLNPATAAISGYSLSDFRDADFWKKVIHPDDWPPLRAILDDALAGRPGRAEVRFQARDGSDKVCYALFQPRTREGPVVGVTVLGVDMTVQRQLEKQLEQSHRLEQVGWMASGIAHDFNNLLTVVLALSDMAQERLPEHHPVRDDLRRIVEAGEQATRLAGQLLTISKRRGPVPAPVDLNRLAARTLDLLRGTLSPLIQVETRFCPGALPVEADETQLHQILMNLCLNARDAMPFGGKLTVATSPPGGGGPGGPREERAGGGFPSASFGNWVCLRVSDTGHGIEEKVRARIFDPYFSTKENGTGLGLAVVRQIVENAGGQIEVSSEPGKGSSFTVWLPPAGPSNGSPDPVRTKAVSGSPGERN